MKKLLVFSMLLFSLWANAQYASAPRIDVVRLDSFLRVNTWIKRWFDIDYSPYTLKSGGYQHLPLDVKIEALKRIKFAQMSICEDVPEHYEYFKANFNYNQVDCCNLNIPR
jgi:hypothetical protein